MFLVFVLQFNLRVARKLVMPRQVLLALFCCGIFVFLLFVFLCFCCLCFLFIVWCGVVFGWMCKAVVLMRIVLRLVCFSFLEKFFCDGFCLVLKCLYVFLGFLL